MVTVMLRFLSQKITCLHYLYVETTVRIIVSLSLWNSCQKLITKTMMKWNQMVKLFSRLLLFQFQTLEIERFNQAKFSLSPYLCVGNMENSIKSIITTGEIKRMNQGMIKSQVPVVNEPLWLMTTQLSTYFQLIPFRAHILWTGDIS